MALASLGTYLYSCANTNKHTPFKTNLKNKRVSKAKAECVFMIAVVKAILSGQVSVLPTVGARVHQDVGDTSHQEKLVVSTGEILGVFSKDEKAQQIIQTGKP